MKHVGNLTYSAGAKHKNKRVGRGAGSGHGGTAGRGHKGQKSRSGAKIARGFEGGQMPITRRVPKFGFTNRFRVEYQVVNLGTIQSLYDAKEFTNEIVNFDVLYNLGILTKRDVPVKILGDGDFSASLKFEANKFSASAITKIENAGGTAVING